MYVCVLYIYIYILLTFVLNFKICINETVGNVTNNQKVEINKAIKGKTLLRGTNWFET